MEYCQERVVENATMYPNATFELHQTQPGMQAGETYYWTLVLFFEVSLFESPLSV